jgi:segregation and condensation protein B
MPDTENRTMEISQIIPHIESLIFAADRPLPLLEILDLLNNALAFLEDRANLEQVEAALEAIKEKYSTEFYAFEVKERGGGYQFLTKKEYYQTVAQLNGDKFLKRLSTAALETLAIVAYRQPISKGEIEHIRGVSTDYSIQKLLEKELIVITGRSETLPGKPLLYATSKAFMDYFGLNSAKDLPKLKEVFDEESIRPTLIGLEKDSNNDDDGRNMVVSETGELVEQTDAAGNDAQSKLNDNKTPGNAISIVDEDNPAADAEDDKSSVQQAKLFLPFGDDDLPAANDISEADESTETTGSAETTTAADDAGTDTDPSDITAATLIPTMEEALAEETVAEEPIEEAPTATDAGQEEEVSYASEEELAAFLQSAADIGPKGDDEDDEDEDEEEDDEDDQDEDNEDDEDGDKEEEDDDDDQEEDDETDADADGEEDEEDDKGNAGNRVNEEEGPSDADIENADFGDEEDFDEDNDFDDEDEDEEEDENRK